MERLLRMKPEEIQSILEKSIAELSNVKQVLIIHPDYSRNDFSEQIIPILYNLLENRGLKILDLLNAGGTHRKMTEAELEIKLGVSKNTHPKIRKMINHEFDDESQLLHATTLSKEFIKEKTGGNLDQELIVDVNKIITDDYDLIIAISGTVPHEALGYSGGTKIFFPGISGPKVIAMLHWAAVLIGIPKIIGTLNNPAREIVDAGTLEIFKLIPKTKILSLNMVYTEDENHQAIARGLFWGYDFAGFKKAHTDASALSSKLHIKYLSNPKNVVVQALPKMYDEVWTAGKGSYKLQKPGVIADGGEIILYAPHIDCFHSNKKMDSDIRKIGYHGIDYVLDFCKQNPDFDKNIASHVINVRGFGKIESGLEVFPFKVSLATKIPENECRAVNLGYVDPKSLHPQDFQADDKLWISDGGQWLYDRK